MGVAANGARRARVRGSAYGGEALQLDSRALLYLSSIDRAAWSILRWTCHRSAWPSLAVCRLRHCRAELELDSRGVQARNHFVRAHHAARYGHRFLVARKAIDYD